MTVRAALLARWSRRDWLAVAIVAVTSAFLIGTLLLLLTVGAYTDTIRSDLDRTGTVTHYEGLEAAQQAADEDSIVLPLSSVETAGGQRQVVGVPTDAPRVLDGTSVAWQEARLPHPPPDTVYAPVGALADSRLEGPQGTVSVTVEAHPDSESLFPDRWVITRPATVQALGTTGAFVIDPTASPLGSGPTAVPLLSALPFLIAGIGDLLGTLSIGTLAGGLLVGIIVYSVTRMTIQDRHTTIRVYRATGGDPWRLLVLLGVRALMLTLGGVAIGYALGVIATNAVVNLAVTLGVPVSIEAVVTRDIARVLVLTGGLLSFAGLTAGLVAAWPTIKAAPANLAQGGGGPDTAVRNEGQRSVLRPRFLSLKAALPVGGSLTVFVLVVLLLGAFVGAFAPTGQSSGGTIVEEGATHPLNSRVDPGVATALRAQGVAASPEVLLAQVQGGDAYLVRGANYSAFQRVRDVSLTRGRAPARADEAVIGADLARTRSIAVGEKVTLGGSVTPGIRQVTVVGVFEADGIVDDQLVVPRGTVGPLATGSDRVHLIRTNASATLETANTSLVVTGVIAPDRVARNESVPVTISIQNIGNQPASETFSLRTGTGVETVSVRLAPGEATTIRRTYRFSEPGQYTVGVAPYQQPVSVTRANAFVFEQMFPQQAPPGATLIVPALTPNDSTVQNATVTLGSFSRQTNEQGVASMPVPDEPGTYPITIEKPGYSSASQQLTVSQNATRRVGGRIDVNPSVGNAVTRPTVTVYVANPWGSIQTRNVTLLTATRQETRQVRLTAGNVTRVRLNASEVGFDRDLPPGSYALALRADGHLLATNTYRVRGDARVAATMASSGTYAAGSDVDRAIRNVFGNLEVVFATMLLFASLAAAGGTTATFTAAVHGRRRTVGIFRATGAAPTQVLRIIITDAFRIALPATALGISAGFGIVTLLDALGVLVVFGVDLGVPDSLALLGSLAIGSFVVAAVTAGLATWVTIATSPASLLDSH